VNRKDKFFVIEVFQNLNSVVVTDTWRGREPQSGFLSFYLDASRHSLLSGARCAPKR